MAAGDSSSSSLEHTPTWAVGVVSVIFISLSIIMERLFHLLTRYLKRKRKNAMIEAVEKLKTELMLLGFMSLFLAVTQNFIIKICIPSGAATTMLPCRKHPVESATVARLQYYHNFVGLMGNSSSAYGQDHSMIWTPPSHRRLEDNQTADEDGVAVSSDACRAKGKVALVTKEGIHQLHIFIFVLAVMQIVYSVLTMALGRAKMRRWKAWEKETQTIEYQVANDPNRFRFTRQTTFGRRHMTACTESPLHVWINCFFRQFLHSVPKVDYLTLRHGFISAHLSSRNNDFNFQEYIQRSLEEDFYVVVSISPLMWFMVVILLLVDVHGWHAYLWLSYVPLLIALVIGAKLEVIVVRMALKIRDKNNVTIGTPLVTPNDNLFWFGRPRFVLTLLHYTLFVNAFELAIFIWVSVQFGINSCLHEHTAITITRVVLAVTVQVLCSYITLPLYALVTQMGSGFKNKPLEEQMGRILRKWHAEVRERRNQGLGNMPSEWSPRKTSANQFSSMPSKSIHQTNTGEIMEEDETEIKAKSTGGPYIKNLRIN